MDDDAEEESTRWNPRYMAYCRAHGEPNPDKMLLNDDETWPGGKMTGFIIWIADQWRLFFLEHPELRGDLSRNPSTHDLFDRWQK